MPHRVGYAESPEIIARNYGISVDALLRANPHKPVVTVAGKRTWRDIRYGEGVSIPAHGAIHGLGAVTPAARNAPHATIQQGSTGPDVALWQTIIGVTADGNFGSGTAAATKSWQGMHGRGPDGIVGPLTWATALGTTPPPASTAPVVSTPAASSSGLASAAAAALAALNADSNYCSSVAKTGTAVNTAVHNFKAAWNAANPGRAVPIGTGKYEVVVAAALFSALGGTPVPPGCGAAGTPAAPPAQMPPVSVAPPIVTPVPAPAAGNAIPTAVQAITSFNPCDQANVNLVRQAQNALGLTADGKYGPGTAAAVRQWVPSAPAACDPHTLWWGAPGSMPSAGGGGGSAPPAFVPPPVYVPPPTSGGGGNAPPAPPIAPPSGGGGGLVAPVASETKKLSTGAIVVGAVGAAALVGLIAAVSMSKKPGHRGTAGRPGKSARRKPTHHPKKHARKKKR